jgi:hypothetical protein
MSEEAAEGRHDAAAAAPCAAAPLGIAGVGDGRAVDDDEKLPSCRCRY